MLSLPRLPRVTCGKRGNGSLARHPRVLVYRLVARTFAANLHTRTRFENQETLVEGDVSAMRHTPVRGLGEAGVRHRGRVHLEYI